LNIYKNNNIYINLILIFLKFLREYLAAINTKCCYNNYTCNGQPIVKYHKANQSNTSQYFIGCNLYTFGTRHRYISGKPNVDEDLLKELFKNGGRVNMLEVINIYIFFNNFIEILIYTFLFLLFRMIKIASHFFPMHHKSENVVSNPINHITKKD
jgi:hypothetical protein